MNAKLTVLCMLFSVGGTPIICFAHEEPVHEAISQTAALSSPNLNSFLVDQLGAQDAPFLEKPSLTGVLGGTLFSSPIGWIKTGSRTEDFTPRYKNHFYDPTKDPPIGLTDGFDAFAISSWEWVTTSSDNQDKWQAARNYQLLALTESDRIAREYALAHTLYTLGRIIHLNQDLSQPDHTRNDNHTTVAGMHPSGPSWIEPYGEKNLEKHKASWLLAPPPERRGWSYWRGVGFQKLKDYWDRDVYTGQAGELNSDTIPGGTKLGLAEFSNGNFLGEDALYAEYFTQGDKHYFPFPSLWTSTTFPAFKNGVSPHAKVSYLKDGTSVNRLFIKKNTDGIVVERHSVLLYLGLQGGRGSGGGWIKVASTINDDTVLEAYHTNLIPKAVEYSAGLLDYFFRGRLDVVATWDEAEQDFHLTIVNNSGQNLQGGEFHLYWDDANHNRSEVTTADFSDYQGSIPDGDVLDFVFDPPPGAVGYTLVYRGTIGSNGAQALDPVDSGRAIAAASFTAREITTPNPLPDGTVNLTYNTQLEQTGLPDPVQWTIIAGTLPSGLSLNPNTGVISGTPTTAQSSQFTVKAQNGSANCQKVFELNVDDCPPGSSSTIGGLTWVKNGTLGGTASGGTVTFSDAIPEDPNVIIQSSFTSHLCLSGTPGTVAHIKVDWDFTWTTLGDGFGFSVYLELYPEPGFLIYGGIFNWDSPLKSSGSQTFDVTFDSLGRGIVDFDMSAGAGNSTITGTVTLSVVP